MSVITLAALLKTGILPILQSILAAPAYDKVKNIMYADDGSDNDAFRKVMRDAFVDAVKKTRKEANDEQLHNYEVNEFRHYQKVAIDEIVHLEPSDRKKYIDQDLYAAFKYEILRRQDTLSTLNLSLAQECVRMGQENELLLTQLISDVKGISDSVNALLAESNKASTFSGLTPSRIISNSDVKVIEIPVVHSERDKYVGQVKAVLEEQKSVLLYAGVKEGKTIASGLLAKALNGYSPIWLLFGYENSINLENALKSFNPEERILFVLDGIKYNDDRLYEQLCGIVQKARSDNWLFVLNGYDRLSDCLIDIGSQIAEVNVPYFSEEEVNEMIPEDKREVFGSLIYASFKGHPWLTQILCSLMANNGWTVSINDLGKILTFPKNTTLQGKVRRLTQQMIKDEEAYHLLNRLMLFNRPFTEDECCYMASITPVITNPLKRLESLKGSWVQEKDGQYEVTVLLQKSLAVDLVKKEKEDCCSWMARKIIGQPNGVSPTDALRALSLLMTTEDGGDVAGFYVSFLYKLDETKNLTSDQALIWRLIWMDVPLPEWMDDEEKVFVRVAQLLLLVIKNHEKGDYIIHDIESRLPNLNNKSMPKLMASRVLCMYYMINGESTKALGYRKQMLSIGEIGDMPQIEDDRLFLLTLNDIKSKDDLIGWAENYMEAGRPEIDVLGDGLIMVINRLCDQCQPNEREELLKEICQRSNQIGFDDLTTACCARLIDYYSEQNRTEDARTIFNEYKRLADTQLGSILLNYSYGLCLSNHEYVDESIPYIEKACRQESISKACAVMMNATTTLAQIMGNQGKPKDALQLILELKRKDGYNTYYSEYEQTLIEGSLSYAYWMVGDKVDAVKSLLEVVKWMKKVHSSQSDDYKNVSLRLSVLALYMATEINGKEPDDKFAQPDYGVFTKQAPSLLKEYKPERNFTVMYIIYDLTEKVLQDDEKCLELIDDVLALQKSDAENMASMLSILLQAYPLCLHYGRNDLVEYILLGALSGYANKNDYSPEDREIDFEHLVLMSAVTATVMKRVMSMAKDEEVDDEWMFELIDRSLVYIPDHQRTDEMIEQMLAATPNYDNINDELIRCIVGTYNIRRISIEDALFVLYVMANSLLKYNQMPSAERFVREFVRAYAYVVVRENPSRFSIEAKELDRYFVRLSNKKGLDYLRGVMNGLYFKMKSEPMLHKEVKGFMDEDL